eukprot:m.70249 g.70249  ORF g.70249 m.70249 type:complete len:175 (+) comp18493_c0_seq5:229-753(+)
MAQGVVATGTSARRRWSSNAATRSRGACPSLCGLSSPFVVKIILQFSPGRAALHLETVTVPHCIPIDRALHLHRGSYKGNMRVEETNWLSHRLIFLLMTLDLAMRVNRVESKRADPQQAIALLHQPPTQCRLDARCRVLPALDITPSARGVDSWVETITAQMLETITAQMSQQM